MKEAQRIVGIVASFVTSALHGCEWSASRSCRFTPGEITIQELVTETLHYNGNIEALRLIV
jgi:hypothetical protein